MTLVSNFELLGYIMNDPLRHHLILWILSNSDNIFSKYDRVCYKSRRDFDTKITQMAMNMYTLPNSLILSVDILLALDFIEQNKKISWKSRWFSTWTGPYSLKVLSQFRTLYTKSKPMSICISHFISSNSFTLESSNYFSYFLS